MPDRLLLPEQIGLTEEGQGQPVMLLHCSASSSRQWKKLRNGGSERYRFLSLDLTGYGDTALPPDPDGYSIETEVDLVEWAMDGVQEPIHLVGHSFGGAVALQAALRHPGRVRSVYAYEPVLFSLLKDAGRDAEWQEICELSHGMRQLVAAGSPSEAMARFVDYWGGAGAWDAMPPARQAAIAKSAPKLMIEFGTIFRQSRTAGEYASLPMPVRIAAGQASPGTSRAVAQVLETTLGTKAVEWVEGAGHMAPVTDPDLVNPGILAYLAST